MQSRKLRTLLSTVLTLFSLAPPSQTAAAQAIDIDAKRQAITAIDANWRTHPGDDPTWARPGLDDNGWKLIQPNRDWESQGYAEQNNLAWFRFELRVPAHTPSLVLQLPRIDNKSYQLFANGQLVGQTGSLPPQHPSAVVGSARIFTIPVHSGDVPRVVTIAIRLWQAPQLAGVSPDVMAGRAYAGQAETVLGQFSLVKAASLLSCGSAYTQGIVVLIVGAAALLLFWLTRQGFYLWFAFNMLLSTLDLPVQLLSQHFAWSYFGVVYIYILLDFLACASYALFILGALQVRSLNIILASVALCFLSETGPLLDLFSAISLVWADGIYFFCSTTVDILLFWLLVRGWRRGSVDAKLLVLPYTLAALIAASDNLGHWLIDLNVPHADAIITANIEVLQAPFSVSLSDAANIVSLLGLLAVLVYRFARTSREEQRLASALQAAHVIQHQLVPTDLPRLGGLHAEIVYLAAEEVGGDFCQVLPRPDGSIFVAIGDVSGKGLQAAMLGTLAVGALRSIADDGLDPAAALNRLNRVILRTEHAGFITCLCLKLSAAGEVTLANAGHLSPYLNGQEIGTEAGLPLGVAPEIEYQELTLMLPATARLTLLSDGVVEARSSSGELFGFDRTSEISQRPASEIAAAAHKHGQEDDITIITLDWRLPEMVSQ